MSSANKKKNLYLVLDLTPQCTQNEILHAYNRAKVTYSRDSIAAYSLYDDEAKVSIIKEIEDAYFVLGDPRKRKAYDMSMGYENNDTVSDRNSDYSFSNDGESIESNGNTSSSHRDTLYGNDSVSSSSLSHSSSKSFQKKSLSIAPMLTVEKNPAFEKQIQEVQSITGSFLRAVRLYRGYPEDQLAGLCQLKADHIIAIEEERPLNLHHPVYLRGHIILICAALQIPR